MRPASASTSVADKPRQESADDRDARMDADYSFDLRGERSVLAFVSMYAVELVEEFFVWREREYQLSRTTGEGIFDGFRRWQVSRFGSQLFPAAHGLLLFQVRIKLSPEHGGRVLSPGYFDRPSTQKALPSGDAEAVVSKAALGMAMPRPRMGKRATEERIRELDGQAAALLSEGEKP